MHGDEPEQDLSHRPELPPYRVRLPGFIAEEDVGLGDIIKRATFAVGIKTCTGCDHRASIFNRWVVFGDWTRR